MNRIAITVAALVVILLSGCSSWRAGAVVGGFCPAASACTISITPQQAEQPAPAPAAAPASAPRN